LQPARALRKSEEELRQILDCAEWTSQSLMAATVGWKAATASPGEAAPVFINRG